MKYGFNDSRSQFLHNLHENKPEGDTVVPTFRFIHVVFLISSQNCSNMRILSAVSG